MNTSTMKIKPAEGLIVRDPDTRRPLAAKGEVKPKNAYWMRRLRDGDVVEITGSTKRKSNQTQITADLHR